MDQARAFGLDRQVLQQTVAEAALDEEARRMGLGQSDAEIMRMGPNTPVAPARRKAMVQGFARHAALRLQALRDPGFSVFSV